MEAFVTEAFTLLGVGLLFIGLRTYVRISTVGWKGLQADDYLMWFAAVCFWFLGLATRYLADWLRRSSTLEKPRLRIVWERTGEDWPTME